MDITEKYKNRFINEYFEKKGVVLKSYVNNSDSFHIYYDNKDFYITNESELIAFLKDLHDIPGISFDIDASLHYFEFGEFPAEQANKPLPNNETVLSFEKKFLAKQAEILDKKGMDYNGGAADSLALFKKVGADLNEIYLSKDISSETKVILTNIAIKLERLKNLLLSGGVPNFESLQDTILDSANYHVLLAKAINETKPL